MCSNGNASSRHEAVPLSMASDPKHGNVHFNEDQNQTMSISPRREASSAKRRVNLKNVRAKVDTNIGHRLVRQESDQQIKSTITDAAKELLEFRAEPPKPRVSTVMVAYLDDDDEVSKKPKVDRVKKKKSSSEVESMMSRLGLTDEEEEEEVAKEDKDFRMTSQSHFDKNYYELALKAKMSGSQVRDLARCLSPMSSSDTFACLFCTWVFAVS